MVAAEEIAETEGIVAEEAAPVPDVAGTKTEAVSGVRAELKVTTPARDTPPNLQKLAVTAIIPMERTLGTVWSRLHAPGRTSAPQDNELLTNLEKKIVTSFLK